MPACKHVDGIYYQLGCCEAQPGNACFCMCLSHLHRLNTIILKNNRTCTTCLHSGIWLATLLSFVTWYFTWTKLLSLRSEKQLGPIKMPARKLVVGFICQQGCCFEWPVIACLQVRIYMVWLFFSKVSEKQLGAIIVPAFMHLVSIMGIIAQYKHLHT
jgi:hypothetical protein